MKSFNEYWERKKIGFTLVELMVASGLIGLFASIVLMSFQRNVHDERLRAVSRSLLEALLEVQTRARQENTPIKVALDHTKATLELNNITDSNNTISLGSVDLKTSIQGLEQLKICGRTSTATDNFVCDETTDESDLDATNRPRTTSEMVFTPRGTVSIGGLVKLHLQQADRTRCIAVLSPIGMIREGLDDGNGCAFNLDF